MRRFWLLFLLLLPLHAADSKAGRIEALVQSCNAKGNFQGAVLVADKGEVILQKGFGMANLELQALNRPETKFRIGSITKQFTAMLVMQMVAEGKLRLDGRISEYLPEYPATGARITLDQLLAHRSGIPNYTSPEFVQKYIRVPLSPLELARFFWDKPLDFEPGEKFQYSNSGYHLLGLILEKVAGKPYEQLLRERIFDPLEMRDSGYDHTERILPGRAAGYQKTPDGLRNAPFVEMATPFSAGGLYSTVLDLRKWDTALYTQKLLSRKYLDLMFQAAAGENKSYRYGWMIDTWKLPAGKRVIFHGGAIFGFSGFIARLPEDRHFIVLLANILGAEWGSLSEDIARILCSE